MNMDQNSLTAATTATTTNTFAAASSSPSSSTFSPSSSSSTSLFPPLSNEINSLTNSHSMIEPNRGSTSEEQAGTLLWSNVNTFAIPGDDDEDDDGMKLDTLSPPSMPTLRYSLTPHSTAATTTSTVGGLGGDLLHRTTSSDFDPALQVEENESTAVFNISWGGDDKPPRQLHPTAEADDLSTEHIEEGKNDLSAIKLSRPLPKPRGIRKLPEPEPSADGTIDEDVLKRRKNTEAARKSRLKKLLKVDQLESKVNSLQAENAKLVLNNAILESEKRSMKAKEADYQKRIKYLEDIVKSHGLWEQ